MAKSGTEQNAAAILKLAGAHPRGPSDLALRRQELLAALARAVDADVWLWTLQQVAPATLETALLGLVDEGWARPSQRRGWLDGIFSPAFQELLAPLHGRLGGHVTLTRSDLLNDDGWYASEFYLSYRAPYGLDDFIISFYPLPCDLQSVVRLHRFGGRPHFVDRDRELVHQVVGRCTWLHHFPLPTEPPPSATSLSPRERQVLVLLLHGGSKKEIAGQLHLSFHTVNDYVKELYLHFGVKSRAELMAGFVDPASLGGAER